MKATDLRANDVIAITYGAMFPDTYVQIVGIDRIDGDFVAVGINLDDGSTVKVSKPSDYRSGNGSPIGSWDKLSADHAASVVNDFIAGV